ncbi:MAG: hypothetical protein KUG61_10960 [Parvibaculaceae bacterium]|nr:hypothetical protein [Parvibaculaceae bacterium]
MKLSRARQAGDVAAMIPTWKEINDPAFELPDEIEVRRSPLKLFLHFLFVQPLFLILILLLLLSIIYVIVGDPRGPNVLYISVGMFIVLSPIYGGPLFVVYRYLTRRGPSFVLMRDGLYMGFLDGGYLVPWSQVSVVDYLGPDEMIFMRIIVHLDPNEVSGTPVFGRLRMRRGLVNGLKKRYLVPPLIYKIGSRKFKVLMRAYKKAAEETNESRPTT